MSKPVTLKPASERRRESGSPTYPSPITPILAVRLSMRFMRSCAIFGKTLFVIDIVTIIASAVPRSGCTIVALTLCPTGSTLTSHTSIGALAGFRRANLHNKNDNKKDDRKTSRTTHHATPRRKYPPGGG